MRSNDGKILGLLSNNDVTFFIPPYQRNYEWDVQTCEVLYKDIVRVAAANKDHPNTTTMHFFGTVIFYSEGSQYFGQPSKLILVDGQQRLTTIMLFMIAVRDVVTDNELGNLIEAKYLKNNNASEKDVECKIKLKQVESDWNTYKKLILKEPLDAKELNTAVAQNYTYFKSQLEKLDQETISSLIQNGLENFSIVTIQLEPDINKWEKPQEIFESMNSLGKPLSLADLVRNYLLLGKSAVAQMRLYHDYWLKIETNLSGNNNDFSVSAFIRDFMQLDDMSSFKKATATNYKELYRNFKELFEGGNSEELIKKLSEYSENYAVLAGYKSSGNKEIDTKISDLKIVESSGFYSFMLGVLQLRSENKISDSDCLQIFDAIFIYITRRRILRVAHGENREAPLLVKYYDDLINSDNKKETMLSLLSNQRYSSRLPNDNDVRSYLSSVDSNFYNLRICKFIYILIEELLTRHRHDLKDPKLQIEHIMPQTLNDDWVSALGSNHRQIHDDYLNNIGNLTLIRWNQELGNKRFANDNSDDDDCKKFIYEHRAGMQIARDKITDQQNWGEEQIKDRAIYLINLIVDNLLSLPDKFKAANNYSTDKKSSGNRLSFEQLGLVGKEIYYFDDDNIKAEVVGDKLVQFENKEYHLSPLTCEIETRKNRRTKSGQYWGIDKWKYQGKTLEQLMKESANDNVVDDEDE
ncbi:MAG: DUF262 domain-containing protein [Proteobacteria bacterium]|nr:DUF262 domain-containing protein [Candidatus Enterousia onthequi]